jgi:glycosyltransferase involved in cell wall biosynthesis
MIHHGQEGYGAGFLERFVINNADRVICNSKYTMNRIRYYCRSCHCSAIPPGVDVGVFKPDKIDPTDGFFARLRIPYQSPVVLAVGRHIKLKGFRYLIEAAARIKDQVPFVLVIGGQGPETENLRNRARELGLGEQVIFAGRIPNHDLPRLYNRAAVVVQPSIVDEEGNTEGLGVVLIEAMACGIPCVASNVGGIPDIVKDGDNGFLTPPKDTAALAESILTLLGNQELNQKMGENGRRFVRQNYSWAHLTSRTVVLLESLRNA